MSYAIRRDMHIHVYVINRDILYTFGRKGSYHISGIYSKERGCQKYALLEEFMNNRMMKRPWFSRCGKLSLHAAFYEHVFTPQKKVNFNIYIHEVLILSGIYRNGLYAIQIDDFLSGEPCRMQLGGICIYTCMFLTGKDGIQRFVIRGLRSNLSNVMLERLLDKPRLLLMISRSRSTRNLKMGCHSHRYPAATSFKENVFSLMHYRSPIATPTMCMNYRIIYLIKIIC